MLGRNWCAPLDGAARRRIIMTGAAGTHGFRSTFKDWAIEQTDFPHAISEMALAHDIGSGTEKAYRRSDFFEKRRILMEQWADFCASAIQVEPVVPVEFSAAKRAAGRDFIRELVGGVRRRR